MRRRTESDRLLCAGITWLLLLAMCSPVSAQKNVVVPIDYDYELALYRPQITLAKDGRHAIAWESLAKLSHTEEWQVGVIPFAADGSALDEAIYLRDPESCVEEGVEGYRGVQNADIQFNQDGDLFIAMEPEMAMYDGRLHKRPRTIVSKLDQNGQVYFQDSSTPCKGSSLNSSDSFESERPRLDVSQQSGELVLVSNSRGMLNPVQRSPFRAISGRDTYPRFATSKSSRLRDGYFETWHDVAVGHLFSGYSWQRCYVEDETGEAGDCDIVVKFVPHSSRADVLHTAKPLRVNSGDRTGVLNYRPAISMNKGGESIVVWVDYRFSEGGDVLAQRFDSKGWPIGENTRITDGSAVIDDADGVGPEVAINDDGSYMVVWVQDDGNGRRAYGRIISGLDTKEAAFLLDADPHLESTGADVASNGLQFAYTWISVDDFGPTVYYWILNSESLTTRNYERPGTDISFTGYPNPFSEETTLEYVLSKEGHVTLIIYDLLGREVKKLIDKWQPAGAYLVNVPAGELAIGYYVTKLQQGDSQFSKVLIRMP